MSYFLMGILIGALLGNIFILYSNYKSKVLTPENNTETKGIFKSISIRKWIDITALMCAFATIIACVITGNISHMITAINWTLWIIIATMRLKEIEG